MAQIEETRGRGTGRKTHSANDSIGYYEGDNISTMQRTSFGNLRSIIQQKQKKVASELHDRKRMILIIDPKPESRYQNLVDVLDEIAINDVRLYFLSGK